MVVFRSGNFWRFIYLMLLVFVLVPGAGRILAGEQGREIDLDSEVERELDAVREDLQSSEPDRSGGSSAVPGETSGTVAGDTGREKLIDELEKERAARKVLKQKIVRQQKRITGLEKKLEEVKESVRKEKVLLFYNLGRVYQAAGRYEKAKAAYLRALQLDPDEATVHYNLGILYEDDLDEPGKARKHYKRFIEIAPEDEDAPKVMEWLASIR